MPLQTSTLLPLLSLRHALVYLGCGVVGVIVGLAIRRCFDVDVLMLMFCLFEFILF